MADDLLDAPLVRGKAEEGFKGAKLVLIIVVGVLILGALFGVSYYLSS